MFTKILSLLFFVISSGSFRLHRAYNSDARIEHYTRGQLMFIGIMLLEYFMIFKSVQQIIDTNWFWITLIALFLDSILSVFIASFYASIFGYKSKPRISLEYEDFVRFNLHFIDAIITFVLGMIAYFMI